MQTRNFFLGGVLGSLLGFMGFELPNSSALAEDVPCQTTRARDLTSEQVASLEKKLEQDPHDLASRTRLLHYYFGSYRFQDPSVREEMQAAQTRHILWLIRNRPETEVLGFPEGTIDSVFDPEGYSEGKNAWMDRLQREPANLAALEHAANFFTVLEVRTWFTRAAEQGHDGAQMRLSSLYRRKYPPDYSFMTDYVLAYAWLKVALDKGASSDTTVFGVKVPTDRWLRNKMTAEQVAEAEKLAAEIEERIASSKSK